MTVAHSGKRLIGYARVSAYGQVLPGMLDLIVMVTPIDRLALGAGG